MVLTAMYGDKILASLVIHQFMDHPPPDILSVKCWISGGDVITEATADAPPDKNKYGLFVSTCLVHGWKVHKAGLVCVSCSVRKLETVTF